MTDTLQINWKVKIIFLAILVTLGLFSLTNTSFAGTWGAPVQHPSYPTSGAQCEPFPIGPGSPFTTNSSCMTGAVHDYGTVSNSTTQCGGFSSEPAQVMANNSIKRQTCNPSPNNPPNANAGIDRSVTQPASSVVISGASASDPDGGVSSTVWSFTGGPGPNPSITNSTTLTPTFSNMTMDGVYTFRLRVTDTGGLVTTDTMTVTVNLAVTQCNDAQENDSPTDNRTDSGDWGCHSDGDATNSFTYVPTDNSESNTYCLSPGWDTPSDSAYDGDIDGPAANYWCSNQAPGGPCPSNLSGGPTSVSAKGSATVCCYVDSVDSYTGYLRQCAGSSPTPTPAICGSDNGQTISSEPVGGSSACYSGTYVNSPADNSTTWNWTCDGLNNGTDAPCSATKLTYTLTTAVSPGGSAGTVSAPGITCGADCSEVFTAGAQPTLMATPTDPGYDFVNWTGGDCDGLTTTSCLVTLNSNQSITANFVPEPPAFDYSLTPNTQVNTTQNSTAQKVVSKNLISGSGSVTLSVGALPTGVSVSGISGQGAPLPNSSTITFSISPTATVGNHPITITGNPLNKQLTFNLNISPSTSLSVSCSGNPPTALLGQNVTWTAVPSGGTPPYFYSWSGDNIPTSPAPTGSTYVKSYSTVGLKRANVTATDSSLPTAQTTPSCAPAAAEVQINFDPSFEEF
ncbi:MAG: PKD domain-containing protein [Patescibacteria group bacterium]